MIQLSHPYMTTGKTTSLTIWTFVGKVMSLLFNMLSRFVIALFPRSKHRLISWLQSLSTVILEPKKVNSVTVSPFPLLFAMEWWDYPGMGCYDLSFLMLSFKPDSSLSSFILINRCLSSLSAVRVVSYAYLKLFSAICLKSYSSFTKLLLYLCQKIGWAYLCRSIFWFSIL